jgi:hypothetical protein
MVSAAWCCLSAAAVTQRCLPETLMHQLQQHSIMMCIIEEYRGRSAVAPSLLQRRPLPSADCRSGRHIAGQGHSYSRAAATLILWHDKEQDDVFNSAAAIASAISSLQAQPAALVHNYSSHHQLLGHVSAAAPNALCCVVRCDILQLISQLLHTTAVATCESSRAPAAA